MISNLRARRIASVAILAAAAASTLVLGTAPANADTAPPQACGTTQPGPCTETDHFTDEAGLQTPLQPTTSTNCPSWITDDFVLLNMSGNGVEHVTINKAQDFWFTTTFTGDGTASFYPASSLANVVTDQDGNVVSYDIVGPTDATVTGHLTNWFGGSGNNKNAVMHGTIDLHGSDSSGNPVSIHQNQHLSWTGGQIPFADTPHLAFTDIHC